MKVGAPYLLVAIYSLFLPVGAMKEVKEEAWEITRGSEKPLSWEEGHSPEADTWEAQSSPDQ